MERDIKGLWIFKTLYLEETGRLNDNNFGGLGPAARQKLNWASFPPLILSLSKSLVICNIESNWSVGGG
jgi:hypothetical protein